MKGKAVAFVHSTGWYSSANVGKKEDLKSQVELINGIKE